MKHLVIPVIAVGLAVGWLMPGGDDAPEAPTSADTGASDSPRLAASRSRTAEGDAVLSRSSDGHFYADVSVDSADLRMLVDTGASVIALTGSDAEAIGLEWSDEELFPIARGASGDVIGKPVTLEHVRLGDLEASNVEAVIVPRGLDISLLGQSFLGQVGKVEIADEQMVLGAGS